MGFIASGINEEKKERRKKERKSKMGMRRKKTVD